MGQPSLVLGASALAVISVLPAVGIRRNVRALLGGSWAVISRGSFKGSMGFLLGLGLRVKGSYQWGYKSPSMACEYSYPTYNPIYNYP